MADGSPRTDDFLGGDFAGNGAGGSSVPGGEDHDRPRPMQLPRVGWGTDDDDDADVSGGTSAPQSPEAVAMDYMKRGDKDDGSVVSRTSSRTSMGELAPIPEDISMHGGTWPEYYPDLMGCYDYDHDRKKYQYRRCGPKFRRRMCAILLIAFAAIVGSRVSSKMAKDKQQLPQPGTGDASDVDTGGGSSAGTSKSPIDSTNDYPPDAKTQLHPPEDVDIYQAIVDSLHPIMFDDASEWDGTYFHAFQFCGTEYSRVPCPYIAYCPLGPGNPPLGGVKIGTEKNGSWAPVFNSHGDKQHDWVQLGSEGTCELYSKLYFEPPPWGNEVGDNPAEITRHVMCCLESVDGAYKGDEGKGLMSSDPDYLSRPPGLEEDEVEKPIPIRVEEGTTEGSSGERGKSGHRP